MSVSFALGYLARTATPFWQRCLRRSVRLYLALDEPRYNVLEVEAGLQTIELEMSWYLLGDLRPTVLNLESVRGVVEAAQAALLGSRADVEALRAEPLSYRYRVPLDETYILSRTAATGCWGAPVVRRLAQNYRLAA